jgi:CHASE2 domain-containing sensor protein
MNLFRIDTLICTLYIFIVIGILGSIALNIDALDPVNQALQDLETTDIVFTKLGRETTSDTNIVLVNIRQVDRKTIAKQIEILNKYEPKVIGIDAFFRKEKSPDQDFPLMMAFAQTENLVLVSELSEYDENTNCWQKVEKSHPDFVEFAHTGFANVVTGEQKEGFRTVREFVPQFCVADSVELSFTSKIISLYDSAAYNYLIKRGNETEVINWRGTEVKFVALDVEDVLEENFDPLLLKDKIVLMGYIGETLYDKNSLIDIFYTPLNERSAGRAYPDMFGVVVHANVISMSLHKKYINKPPTWLAALIAFVICYLNIALFIYIADRFKVYYDLITKAVQIVEVIFLLFVVVFVMLKFDFKLDLTFAMIVILLSGDLTELYIGSLKGIAINLWYKSRGLTPPEVKESS